VVDAAREHRVAVVLEQHLHRGAHGGQARGTGGIGDEVGTSQVEHVGDSPRHHVGELTRHRVLGDGPEGGVDAREPLLPNLLALGLGQRLEARRRLEQPQVFRVGDAQVRLQVILAPHGGAENDARAIGVERSGRKAIVREGLGRGRHRPLLTLIHAGGDGRRHPESLPVELEVSDPAADLGVGLVRHLGVGMEVVLHAPPLGGNVADAVASGADVLPEGRCVRRLGQHGAEPDDRHAAALVRVHRSVFVRRDRGR
jgi:hypothetical protein